MAVTVIDVTTGTLRAAHTVVIHDGLIVAVASDGAVAVPADARRIDGAAHFLEPGLIDMHTHPGVSDFPLYVANGVTTVRVAGANRRHIVAAAGAEPPRPVVEGSSPVLSPDGRTTFFLDADRTRERLVLWRSPEPACTSHATTRLMAVAVGGGEPRVVADRVLTAGDFGATFDLSADGRTIAYTGFIDDATPALLHVPADGGEARVLLRFAQPKIIFP